MDAYGLWELPSWQDTKESFFNTFNSPRFQGSMEALGGLAEAGFGGTMTLASGGYASPLGWPVMAHGLDHLFTGVQTVVTGRSRNSVTSQVLQEAGLSSETANLVDSSMSVAGSLVGVAIQRGGSGAISSLKVPQQISQLENPLHGTFYKQKVLNQLTLHSKEAKPDLHAFPLIVDNYTKFGKTSMLRGGDGVLRTKVTLSGSYQKKNGYFEWIIETNNSVNHRQFIKTKD